MSFLHFADLHEKINDAGHGIWHRIFLKRYQFGLCLLIQCDHNAARRSLPKIIEALSCRLFQFVPSSFKFRKVPSEFLIALLVNTNN